MATVLTLTLTVPDSHQSIVDKLGIDVANVSLDTNALQELLADVINGTQVSLTVVDVDGTDTVTIPK